MEQPPFAIFSRFHLAAARHRRRRRSLEEILFACKSKRYTLSRLRRMLLCLFLGLTDGDLHRTPPYLHVLGFNDRGREMLRDMKGTSEIPLVTKRIPDDPQSREYAALERRATDLYGLFAPPGAPAVTGLEMTRGPIYRKTPPADEKLLTTPKTDDIIPALNYKADSAFTQSE